MARAMVLSAGLGTRLLPLTEDFPKPLVPVGDRPLIAHIADRLRRGGFSGLVMNTHHAAARFSSMTLSLPVDLVHEPTIRGTAGGVAGARSLLGEGPVLIWNGDILVDPPFESMLAAASPGGLVFAIAPRLVGEGTVGIDGAGHVVRLRGERFGPEVRGGDYVGVAAVGSRTLSSLPETGCLVAEVALPGLRRGDVVRTVDVTGPWTDVGSLATYRRANLDWLAAHGGAGGSWAHASALLSPGIDLHDSVVGAGARLVGEGPVERAVIWPGAHAVAPLADVVVTTSGRAVPTS